MKFDNAELFEKTAKFLGDSADGVPYIVIGDKTFVGYTESYNSQIESTIKTLYESENRYDVFEEMTKEETTTKEESNSLSNVVVVIWNIIIAGIATVIIVFNNKKNKLELQTEITELKKLIKNDKKAKNN